MTLRGHRILPGNRAFSGDCERNLIVIFIEVKEEWQCVIPLLTITISIFIIRILNEKKDYTRVLFGISEVEDEDY